MQDEGANAGLTHQFHAIAFEENFTLRQLSAVFRGARIGAHELYLPVEPNGGIYVYPFGAMVTCDVPSDRREAELARLRAAQPKLTTQIVREDYSVIEQAGTPIGIFDGVLKVDPADDRSRRHRRADRRTKCGDGILRKDSRSTLHAHRFAG